MWTGNPLSKRFDNLSNWQSMTHSVWHFISITKSLAMLGNGWRVSSRFSCCLTVNKWPTRRFAVLAPCSASALFQLIPLFRVTFALVGYNMSPEAQCTVRTDESLTFSWILRRTMSVVAASSRILGFGFPHSRGAKLDKRYFSLRCKHMWNYRLKASSHFCSIKTNTKSF